MPAEEKEVALWTNEALVVAVAVAVAFLTQLE
jgi:hypothetical protein